MKKTLIVTALLMAVTGSAMALDVGITLGSSDVRSQYQGFVGFTVGQKIDNYGITAGYERTNVSDGQSRYNLTGSYDILKFGNATVVTKVGAVYLDNDNGVTNGWAGQVGIGLVYPLTEKVSATVDYRYQNGQSKVDQFNGNSLYAGLKYSF